MAAGYEDHLDGVLQVRGHPTTNSQTASVGATALVAKGLLVVRPPYALASMHHGRFVGHSFAVTWELTDFRLVTASAYPGMMAPLTAHPSCVCVLSGDADGRLSDLGTAALSLEALDGVRRRWRFVDVARLADFVPKVLAETPADGRPILLIPPRSSVAWEEAAATWPGQVRLVGGSAESVGRIAEDKIWVRRQLQGIGVPVPVICSCAGEGRPAWCVRCSIRPSSKGSRSSNAS